MDLFDQLLMAQRQGMRFSLDSGETGERQYRGRGTRGDADAHPACDWRLRAAHNARVKARGGTYAHAAR